MVSLIPLYLLYSATVYETDTGPSLPTYLNEPSLTNIFPSRTICCPPISAYVYVLPLLAFFILKKKTEKVNPKISLLFTHITHVTYIYIT